MAAAAVGFLAACSGSTGKSSSAHRACAPETFACNGFTPGFWSNKNGCAQLAANDFQLLNELNALLASQGINVAPQTCDEVDALVLVSAGDTLAEMKAKLLAMWIAFALNNINFWDEDCFGGPIDFEFIPTAWDPNNCTPALPSGPITFQQLADLVADVYGDPDATRCEVETLKNFFDAANNDAQVCLCDCPTGATGASGSFGE